MDKLIKLFLSNHLPMIAKEIRDVAGEDDDLNMYNYIKNTYGITIDNTTKVFKDEDLEHLTMIENGLDFDLQVEIIDSNKFEEPTMDELDVEDAKNMFIDLTNNDDKFLTRFVPHFSIIVLVISFIYLFVVSFVIKPSSNIHIIQSVTEFIKNIMIMVTSFWIGSSVGSETKTEEIDNQIEEDKTMRLKKKTPKIIDTETFDVIDDTLYEFDDDDLPSKDKTITTRDTFKELLQNNDKFLRRFVPYFSVGVILTGFSYLFLASITMIPDSNLHLISSTIEFIKALMLMVISFWVGSSVSSKIKSNKLSVMNKKV